MIEILGSTPLTAILGAAPDPTNHAAVRTYIKTLCDNGFSVLLCFPNSKKPFDGRTRRQRNADDKKAQTDAQAAGRVDWKKAQSPSGLALASTDHKPITKKNGYLDQYIAAFSTGGCDSCFDDGHEVPDNTDHEDCTPWEPCAVNIAIEVGGSRVVVVDCDTAEQKQNFLETFEAPEDMPPTVVSPGTQLPDGTWAHSDGGHYYFTLDEGEELPVNAGSLTWGGEHGFAVLWDRRYVLIPPSSRPEGFYELVGRDYPLSMVPALRDAIVEHAEAKQNRYIDNATPRTDDLSTDIDRWAEQITWAEILEPLGWVQASRPDNCGCDVWTAPGIHSSPKSATAHDPGCGLNRYTPTNCPLKIWTDNPGEPFDAYIAETKHTTISKLQAVAWAQYEGNIGAAMTALNLGASPDELTREMGIDNDGVLAEADVNNDPTEDIELPQRDDDPDVDTTADQDEGPAAAPADEDSPFADPEGEEIVSDIFDPGVSGLPIIAPFSHWADMPPPEYVIEGLIEHGGFWSMIGEPGIGKSGVALDMALAIATGRPWQGRKTLRTRVLYLPGEGLSGAVQRVKAWALMHDMPREVIDEGVRLGNDIVRIGASNEAWGRLAEYVLRQRIELIIFDTFARMATGIEENSATEVGKAVVRLDNIRRLTNCGVGIVHHTAKHNPRAGRGSSALNGALDSELLIAEASWSYENLGIEAPAGKALELVVTKQKNAEQPDEPIPLLMRNCAEYSAPYITGPTGEVDPMLGDVVLARPRPESLIETAIRVYEFLRQFTDIHPTKAEIAAGVKPDPYTRSRTDSARAWKQTISLAIDLGMRYDLIAHPRNENDTLLTSKFVLGVTSPESARTEHNRAMMSEGTDD